MQKTDATELLRKFRNGQCSEEELALLETWYNQYAPARKVADIDWVEDVHDILKSLENIHQPVVKVSKWKRTAVAASFFLCISIGLYLLITRSSSPQIVENQTRDIRPGSNRAILTLANGQQISLNGNQKGKLAQQGNAAITKTAEGQVVYQANGENNTGGENLNTVTTPLGGQYHIVLADGTQAWLNAGSSITYPAVFAGNKRTVQITGEVYFEVAHNAAKPFRVKSNGQLVEVLGTHFNINSYDNEPAAKTTLLEGSVRINDKTVLKPDEQAIVSGTGLKVIRVDTELAVAWKNNKFMFDNDSIESVMRMVERWYDVKVDYEGEIPEDKFGGSVSRFASVSKVLNILELTGKVHFKVKGRRITVTK